MTQIPIKELTNEQLVEAVAIEVMGWTKSYTLLHENCWNPTESIEQAMQVFDKMNVPKSKRLDISKYDNNTYCVTIRVDGYGDIHTEAGSFQDLPLAICRAALEAVRAK